MAGKPETHTPDDAWFQLGYPGAVHRVLIQGIYRESHEVMAMQLKVLSDYASPSLGQRVPDLFVTLDQWDGYPAERALRTPLCLALRVST